MMLLRLWILVAAALFAASAAPARDLIVILENRDYRTLPDVTEDLDIRSIVDAAEISGAEVFELRNATARRLRARSADRLPDLLAADRLTFVLSGHFVNDGHRSWLLGVDAPARSSVFGVGAQGIAVDAILSVLGSKPGAATLLVAPAGGRDVVGPLLSPGFVAGRIPQGVSVVSGNPGDLSRLLADDLLTGRLPIGRAVSLRQLEGAGFLPEITVDVPQAPVPQTASDPEAWRAARAADTAEAYRRYLDDHPQGAFRDQAQDRLAALTETPDARARRIEAALGLSRPARREVQRNLSILGYDPRGIDGIFGPGTRIAIRAWQRDEGLDATGFVTGNQVVRLQDAAARRQEELEAEARARQEEEDRNDRALWAISKNDEPGLRRYLERYPDGLFAETAQDRLAAYEAERARLAEVDDRRAWERARRSDSPSAYREYLDAWPEGAFRREAEARIDELDGDGQRQSELAAAKAEEGRIMINKITRLLVERRLAQLDLEPGPADGVFDDDTRRAIRRYQGSRDLEVTGYVDQETLVRMLAGN